MDNIIVYVDDASHAVQMLQPMVAPGSASGPTRWILVGCAPRVTQQASRFVTHSARDGLRRKWADKVFGQVTPLLQKEGHAVVTLVAQGPLIAQTEALLMEHGTARVLDARRPKLGQDLQPVLKSQMEETHGMAGDDPVPASTGVPVAAD